MTNSELKNAVLFVEKCQKLWEHNISDVKEKLSLLQNSGSDNLNDILRLRLEEWSLDLEIGVFRLAYAYLQKLIETSEV